MVNEYFIKFSGTSSVLSGDASVPYRIAPVHR